MSIENTPPAELPARTDLIAALVWIVIGGAITSGAWTMDRLERLHINRYEAPGLVPGLLGAAILLLGLLLAVRSVGRGALRRTGASPPSASRRHMALVLGATLLYAGVLVGHGMPFWLASFVFVSGFILYFDAERQAGLGRSRTSQAWRAALYGMCTSGVVSLAFEQIFLVRLP